jgi:ABC-type transport system substrate-binding protein
MQASDCNYGGLFKAMEALNQHTVRFTLCEPDVAFLSKIAFPSFSIYPREWLESTDSGEISPLREGPIGTGPYMLDEWIQGQELIFKAFDPYWGEKARTPRLVFRWNKDASQRLLELQTSTVDGIDNVNSTDFASVEADPALILIKRPALNVFYIGINNTSPPLDDEKVRQAIAMGIDRQHIVDEAFPIGYELAAYFTPCAIPNACEGEAWYDFDPVQARELLAEVGFPDGFQTELSYRDVVRGYLPRPGLVAEVIKDQLWDNLKIKLKIKTLEPTAYLEAVDEGSLPGLHLLGWGADYPDITNFLDSNFGATAPEQFGDKFEAITSALEKGRGLTGSEARGPYYEAANNAIKQHVPAIPVSHGGWAMQDSLAVAYKAAVEGAHASPLNLEIFSAMSVPGQETFVWMQKAEPFSLYCADETDGESLRACAQISEPLYRYQAGSVTPKPALAEVCTPNDDLTVWTCNLRQGVMFHNGSSLDANDVVMSLLVQWDASHPLHKGNTGAFHYFHDLWEGFLNTPDQ